MRLALRKRSGTMRCRGRLYRREPGRARPALQEMPVRRLLPLLLGGALLGLGPVPTLAQNVCSPSTAASTMRYPGYPSSMPYSGSTTNITSNCSGPTADVQVTPDPYAGQAYPVPGYPYGPMTI